MRSTQYVGTLLNVKAFGVMTPLESTMLLLRLIPTWALGATMHLDQCGPSLLSHLCSELYAQDARPGEK